MKRNNTPLTSQTKPWWAPSLRGKVRRRLQKHTENTHTHTPSCHRRLVKAFLFSHSQDFTRQRWKRTTHPLPVSHTFAIQSTFIQTHYTINVSAINALQSSSFGSFLTQQLANQSLSSKIPCDRSWCWWANQEKCRQYRSLPWAPVFMFFEPLSAEWTLHLSKS